MYYIMIVCDDMYYIIITHVPVDIHSSKATHTKATNTAHDLTVLVYTT